MRNLTPQSMRCPLADCPGVYELEDGRLLIVGENVTDIEQVEREIKVGPNEAVVIIDPALLSEIPEIARLRAGNERLREALRPFAKVAEKFEKATLGDDPDDEDHEIYREFIEEDPSVDSQVMSECEAASDLLLSDFRRALAALSTNQEDHGCQADVTETGSVVSAQAPLQAGDVADAWLSRWEAAAFPYQEWHPFLDHVIVDVMNNIGEMRTARAGDLWWGYEHEMGVAADGVIVKARRSIEKPQSGADPDQPAGRLPDTKNPSGDDNG